MPQMMTPTDPQTQAPMPKLCDDVPSGPRLAGAVHLEVNGGDKMLGEH